MNSIKLRMDKTIDELKLELNIINARIATLSGRKDYTDRVAGSFHMGMVGGSGKNTARLNKIREISLERTIANAVMLTTLCRQQSAIEREIKDLETSGPQRREEAKKIRNQLLAQYWRALKAGDILNVGNSNGNPRITKKNPKSCETGPGCVWRAAEIIGREAAKLL